MANLITHSLSYSKEEIYEYVISPIFVENDIRDLVTIRTGIKSREKLDFFASLEKITRAYAQGSSFSSTGAVALTQKTLTVSDMKAQIEQNAKAFEDSVKQQLLASGYKQNDLLESDRLLEQVVLTVYMQGLKADMQRQIWFGKTNAETFSSNIPTGTADVDYNIYQGFFDLLMSDVDSATIPAAQYLDLNTTTYLSTAGVKEVDTATVSGASGILSMTINGVAYAEAFDTDVETTIDNWVASHAATILAREGKVVAAKASASTITITAGVAGCPISTVDSSTTMAASIANTTANTEMGDFKADGALAAVRALHAKMPTVLRKMKKEAKIMCTVSVIDNYATSLESGAHDGAQKRLVDGVDKYYFRGIELVEMADWDDRITNDLGGCLPHRMVMTIPKNLIVGCDGDADDMMIENWYEKKDQLNYWRTEYKIGVQYYHESLVALAY